MSSLIQSEIKVLNSLTRQKETLTHSEERKLTWYGCGPTVYDSPHIGHARTYVSFDIIRRVLTNYFNMDVSYCMNITDIDDKIIRRARQRHLIAQYIKAQHTKSEIIYDVTCASQLLLLKVEEETDPMKKDIFNSQYTQLQTHINSTDLYTAEEFLAHSSGILSEYLDGKHGHSVNDNSLFMSLPRQYEDEFFQTMDILGVIRPNFVTRVTEYVPQIVEYIQKIIKNGFAYVSPSGSVYFDVPQFSKQHMYAKLVPESASDLKSLAEGEGSLTFSGDKRSSRDFALWKASKEGEPSWDSPWSKGRPGWHIECSVMANCVFGPQMDIHSGGCDLKFPHHDNEIAQAEAYFNGGVWVKNFWHSGHLTINGCKMSKSLKNFITIESALLETSPRRLRLLFLLHVWNQPFDYSPDALNEGVTYEKQLMEFLLAAKSFCRTGSGGEEDSLQEALTEAHKLFRKAMCDSFNTRQAMNDLKSLISVANSFMNSKITTGSDSVRKTADFIIRTLNLFGVVETDCLEDFSIFRTTLSPTTVIVDISPFVAVIEHTLNLFIPRARVIHKLVSELECDNSGDIMVSNLAVAVKCLLIYSEKTVDTTLSELYLNVTRLEGVPPSESVKLGVSEPDLVGCVKDHKNFESLAFKYVECVSRERDLYRYTCIAVLKSIKQMKKSKVVGMGVLKSLEETVKTLFGECDVVRKELLDLGVKLEDFSGGVPAAIKFYDVQLLGLN